MLLAAGVTFVATTAQADAHDSFNKAKAAGEKVSRLISSLKLPPERTLEAERKGLAGVREIVAQVHAHEAELTGPDVAAAADFIAKMTAWADAYEKTLAAEEQARTDVIVPLCEATWGAENERADIAREKANPSGVVNLRALHDAGERLQHWQDQIADLKPKYAALRKHDFASWQSEGACVAENEKP